MSTELGTAFKGPKRIKNFIDTNEICAKFGLMKEHCGGRIKKCLRNRKRGVTHGKDSMLTQGLGKEGLLFCTMFQIINKMAKLRRLDSFLDSK